MLKPFYLLCKPKANHFTIKTNLAQTLHMLYIPQNKPQKLSPIGVVGRAPDIKWKVTGSNPGSVSGVLLTYFLPHAVSFTPSLSSWWARPRAAERNRRPTAGFLEPCRPSEPGSKVRLVCSSDQTKSKHRLNQCQTLVTNHMQTNEKTIHIEKCEPMSNQV